ncbi:MAG TPA: hypothetical protein VGK33_14885, partial [Chloroflexota bacterium]
MPRGRPVLQNPSRAYWLQSHNGGVSAKTRRHEGPLLDPSTLPALPGEPRRQVSALTRSRKSGGSSAEPY